VSSEEATAAERQFPTPLQIYVLAHLTSEESKRIEESHPYVPQAPIEIRLRDLIIQLPTTYVPEKPIIEEVRNQLKALEDLTYLHSDGPAFNNPEIQSYSVTLNGMMYVKQFLAMISFGIKEQKITEKDMDRAGGDSGVIKFMKETWGKFKDKSPDQIADMLFLAIRTQGLPLVRLVIDMTRQSSLG
jgi:hypothetical protein